MSTWDPARTTEFFDVTDLSRSPGETFDVTVCPGSRPHGEHLIGVLRVA